MCHACGRCHCDVGSTKQNLILRSFKIYFSCPETSRHCILFWAQLRFIESVHNPHMMTHDPGSQRSAEIQMTDDELNIEAAGLRSEST